MGCCSSAVSPNATVPKKAKDTVSVKKGRPNSAKDTVSGKKGRPNSAKDTVSGKKGRPNSAKDTVSGKKGRPNSAKDTVSGKKGRPNSAKDTVSGKKGRPNSAKYTTAGNRKGPNSGKDKASGNRERPNSGKTVKDDVNQYQKIDENARKAIKSVKNLDTNGNQSDHYTGNGTTSSNKEKPGSGQGNKDDSNQYQKIDAHARKAPKSLKNSAEELVTYMSTVTKDPRMLVRGFFVWISENIKYDVEGYFEQASMAPCDAESVMKGGRSVCAGYANVMELLCRQASIPVKRLSGFAKGYSHSAANPFTLEKKTNHAWNAVQIKNKWCLIDSTWGTGHLDKTKSFKKELDDFYFLTDPKDFVSSHFPYMDKDMEESEKWQLLSQPISLDEFNTNVKYKPDAFKLGAQAVSHQQGYIEIKNELQMTFKSVGKEELVLSARLKLKEGNMLKEQPNATFGYPENGLYKLMIHPPKPGTYTMNVFGKAESLHGYLMEYLINCTEVKELDFEYPMSYAAASIERSVLHEPLRGKLPGNTEIKFRVSAPHLQNVMVGNSCLEKSGTMFTGNITTGAPGQKVSMYGTRGDKYSRMQGLYAFKTS